MLNLLFICLSTVVYPIPILSCDHFWSDLLDTSNWDENPLDTGSCALVEPSFTLMLPWAREWRRLLFQSTGKQRRRESEHYINLLIC